MKTTTIKYAEILSDVLMKAENRPDATPLASKPDTVLIASGGRLKGAGWVVSIVIIEAPKSLTISVQLKNGRRGYSTDILNQFLSEETIREYAEHALAQIIEKNTAERLITPV